jgi:hypothetical protein
LWLLNVVFISTARLQSRNQTLILLFSFTIAPFWRIYIIIYLCHPSAGRDSAFASFPSNTPATPLRLS